MALVTVMVLVGAGGWCGASTHADLEGSLVTRALDGRAHPVPSGWRVVFRDGFNGDELNRSVWNDCHWWAIGGCTIQSNHELEWYLPDNVSVANGRLRLHAREQDVTAPDGRQFPYSSGMVTTGPPYGDEDLPARFAFTYGYVEARLRLPSDTGLWPAWWMLPADEESRPEIDILETVGDTTTQARFHFHYLDDDERRSAGHRWTGPDLAEGWHTFAVDWRPGKVTWIVDGRARWRITGDAVPSEPMYLVLNLAVGGDYPGPPDEDTTFPAAVKADWIRVWQAP